MGGSMRTPSWPTALLIAALPSRSAAHGALHRTAKTARALGGIKHGAVLSKEAHKTGCEYAERVVG